jgi:hypothetical protein
MTEQRRIRRAGTRLVFCLLLLAVGTTPSVDGASALTTDGLLDELQQRAFLYFWNEANPDNGLVKDRSTPWSPGKMAATGFGLSAICVGIDHGWVTREAGRERILTALETLWSGPQGPEANGNIGYKGFFYHFVDLESALRTWESELSPIDTALLFAGIIDAREFFSSSEPLDIELRSLADSILHRADWSFFYNGLGIPLAWTPEEGFHPVTWLGYNEAMIMYLLAIGSPTHPIPASAWFTWTAGYNWSTHYGYSYLEFPPLFGHQYTHCWVDLRNIQDIFMASRGITYWENSRRATLAQRAYCMDNPFGWAGYEENVWGLTASDDPGGYLAHGAPPPQHDNGTITPTAAASSIPFAPEVVIPVLHELYETYGPRLWSTYGFRDAFNPTQNWFATDYLGIDQGPIIVMIENYRTESVWNRVMLNADVQRGLSLSGFQPTISVQTQPPATSSTRLRQNTPNPFRLRSTISYRLPATGMVRLVLYDALGRSIRTLVDGVEAAGEHEITLNSEGLKSGVYYYRLDTGAERLQRRSILIR